MFSRFSPSAAIHEFRDRQEVQNGGAVPWQSPSRGQTGKVQARGAGRALPDVGHFRHQ